MVKYLLLLLSLPLFVGCNDEAQGETTKGSAVSIPIGTYHSNCTVVGTIDSKRYVFILGADENRIVTLENYTGNPFCNGTPVSDPAEVASIQVSDVLLGPQISYFEDAELGFVPYYLNGDDLYLGEGVDSFAGDVSQVFADFIADPIPNTTRIYRLQD